MLAVQDVHTAELIGHYREIHALAVAEIKVLSAAGHRAFPRIEIAKKTAQDAVLRDHKRETSADKSREGHGTCLYKALHLSAVEFGRERCFAESI